jgi:hypothetical protein
MDSKSFFLSIYWFFSAWSERVDPERRLRLNALGNKGGLEMVFAQ